MASFNLTAGKKKKNGEYAIYVRIIANRSIKYIPTGIVVDHVRGGLPTDMRARASAEHFLAEIRQIYFDVGNEKMSAGEIADAIELERKKRQGFDFDFAEYMVLRTQNEAFGTRKTRLTALRSLCRFLGTREIHLSSLKKKTLQAWINSLPGNRAPSLYRAQMQAIFNQAMREFNDEDEGYMPLPFNPFKNLVLPKAKQPIKRALTVEQIRAIAALPDKGIVYDRSRDMFLLSFLLVGMNSADLYCCGKLRGGRVEYERQKTRTVRADSAFISIAVPPMARPLLKKYKDDERLLDMWRCYISFATFNKAINTGLKQVGADVGIEGLTFYAARHSWATIAINEAGVDKWTVHLALNHVDANTSITDAYIKKDWRVIDAANEKVLALVFGENK